MVEWGMLLAPLLAAAISAGPVTAGPISVGPVSIGPVSAGPVMATVADGRVCRIADQRLDELSGLVATTDGYIVVNDGADKASHRKIFYLSKNCSVRRTVSYPSRPRDTEDLQLGRDGTLWVADIGDNGASRNTIALWKLAPGASKPSLFRLSYPDGARDAEALLIAPDGTPIIVTKTAGSAGIYIPAEPLKAKSTTTLKLAGSVAVPLTTTSNPYSFAGRLVITGAATSPDGARVVLRTYADAFEYDVPDGDVVKALTSGTPRQVALPDEPQGESIAYTPDGTALLTVSEGSKPSLLRYPLPSAPSPAVPSTPGSPGPGSPDSASSGSAPPGSVSSAPPAPALAAAQTPAKPSSRLPLALFLIAATTVVLAAAVTLLRRRSRGPR